MLVVNNNKRQSPLVIGAVIGFFIGMLFILLSSFVNRGMIDLPFMLFVGAILGFITGAIFAIITAPFLDNIAATISILSIGTLIAGIMALLIGRICYEDNFVVLSWPAGMLGYWFSFIFRKDILTITNFFGRK